MKICCKDINYSFDNHPQYSDVRNTAVETVKEMYEDNKRFEQEEAEEMLKDGDINDLSEYDFSYTEPFDESRYAAKISDLTNQYMRNVTDVPKDAVFEIDVEKVKDVDESEVKRMISEKYGVSVNNIRNIDKATNREIMAQETYDNVGKMLESNDYQTFLNLKSSIENYSFRNIAMIYGQKPDAQAVKGFSAWSKELNRTIIKGEHALKIWCPSFKTLKTEEDVDRFIKDNSWKYTSQASKDKDKDRMIEEIEKNGYVKEIIGYTQGNVFDISQTASRDPEHDNIEAILHIGKPLDSELANYNDVAKALENAFSGTIRISNNKDISEQERLYTAVSSYSDKVLSERPESVDGIKSATPLKGDMHKLEVLVAASLISKHIGIESDSKTAYEMTKIFSNPASKEYITEGKRGMFEKAFERGSKLSAQFDKTFDKELGYDIEALRKAALDAVKAEAEADSQKYVYFGRTKCIEADQWETKNTKYIIGQNPNSGVYYVKTTDLESKKGDYIRSSDGKPEKFSDMPSRADIESRNEPVKDNTKENKKSKQKTGIELD